MKKISYLLAISLSVFLTACDKDDDTPNPVVNFSATLNGAAETPPNASTATGSATGTYNTSTKTLSVTTTYSGITPTLGHIHKGAVGVKGDVVFPFTSLTSPIVFTTTLDAAQESDLMAGLYYVNLHTVAFGGGEIRGQLIKQ